MPSPTDPYSEHSETLEAVLAHICRRHRLTPDFCDEFRGWARLRLVENDYAIIRKFRGHSSLRTFLTTVVLRLFLDWRNAELGRWRNGVDARREGPIGIELDRLVNRDGHPYEEAVQTLISRGLVADRRECDRVWTLLPRRQHRRMTSDEALVNKEAPDPLPDRFISAPPPAQSQRVRDGFASALRRLEPQEQLLLRLRYLDRFTMPKVAEALALDPKPLYRRFEQIHGKLGQQLKAAGLAREEIMAVLDDSEDGMGGILAAVLGKPKNGPSTPENAGGTA